MARTAIFLSPGADLAAAVDLARRADAAGYESVWVTHGIGRDGLHVLAAYAHAAPRVGLGTGILPIYPRHPVLMAQEALTVQEISGGRLLLGIGVSHRPMMEASLGLDMGRPLEVRREPPRARARRQAARRLRDRGLGALGCDGRPCRRHGDLQGRARPLPGLA